MKPPNLLHRLILMIISYSFRALSSFLVCCILLICYIFKRHTKFWEVRKREIPNLLVNKENEYGKCKFAKLTNIKLHYIESGDQSKPLILFVHGFPDFWYSWRHQIKEFYKDYWTVAVDMRGYSKSDKPEKVSDYHIDKLVEDIRELVKFFGRQKFSLVAHDWGAIVGWRFLEQHKNLVDRFVMVSGIPIEIWMKLMLSEQLFMSWHIFFFQIPYLPEFVLKLWDLKIFDDRKDAKEIYKFVFSQPNAFRGPLNYYRANPKSILFPESSPTGDSEFCDARGIFILGENEPYISRKSGKLIQKHFPNVTIKIIPATGHNPHIESPEIFNEIVREELMRKN